ncbi:hypothetical protein T459_11430 [Capsicum annuum]|uniref:CCHC-type domain-containing protein n=1 Tax=Capsicum annuum TaxID=4072 RepID=A0A2G2ZLW8_CAPAN|nr:hypothetical protein T459_11430 [Capsicum annuum]
MRSDRTYPLFEECGKNYLGVCRAGSEVCFGCGKLGHRLREYRVMAKRGSNLSQQGATFSTTSSQCQNRFYALQTRPDRESSPNIDSGIIPQEIGILFNLVELGMEDNQITGSVPISILNISSLQIFSLRRNNLSGFLPREIGNLTKMQHLQIGGNKLIGEIPNEISNLVELKLLSLRINRFSGSLDMEIVVLGGLSEEYEARNRMNSRGEETKNTV